MKIRGVVEEKKVNKKLEAKYFITVESFGGIAEKILKRNEIKESV